MSVKKSLITFIFASLFIILALIFGTSEASAAGGLITDEYGATYSTFNAAFAAVPEGGSATFTISGDTVNASGSTDNTATLTKNANVTILASGTDTVINGKIGINSEGKLIMGQDENAKKLNIKGFVFADKGTLEVHSETIISTTTDAYDTASVIIGSSTTNNAVKARINGATIISDEYGILVQGSATSVDYINSCKIDVSSDDNTVAGIYVRDKSSVTLIDKNSITVEGNNAYGFGVRIHGSTVNTISDSEITVKKSEASGIDIREGGLVETIINNAISIEGRRGFPLSVVRATVGTIDKCDIDVSVTALTYGIYIQPGKVDYIRNTTVDVYAPSTVALAFAVYQQGPVKEVSGCTFNVKGESANRCGYNIVYTPLYSDENFTTSRVDVMKNNKIYAHAYALGVQQDGQLGELSGNHMYASSDNYGCILLSSGGTIETINSGTYASKGNGVFINYGSASATGHSKVRTGNLKKIGFEEVKTSGGTEKVGPVFYGETGWAINANTEAPAPQIKVEVEQLEADQPLKGYARYYGGAAKSGGMENGDSIIGKGSTDRDLKLDAYPVYKDSEAEGTAADPLEYLYFMSRNVTDTSVEDSVLKEFANVDLKGVTFHYLTVKARLSYDSNDYDKNPRVKDATAMDGDKILDEPDTAHEIAENKFERQYHTFVEWNTEKDGSGESYAYSPSGDSLINLKKASTTLYAIWKREASDPVIIQVQGKKILTGEELDSSDISEGDFIFTVKSDEKLGGNTAEIPVKAGGNIDFGTYHFTSEGTYTFTIKEKDLGEEGYTYDGSSFEYTVVITLNENTNQLVIGDLSIKKDGQVAKDILFENSYEKPEDPEDPEDPENPDQYYKITYKMNGGQFDGSSDNIAETYKEGAIIKIHEAPEREGYTFKYWKGSEYQPGDEYTVLEDHTFTAQWEEITADSEPNPEPSPEPSPEPEHSNDDPGKKSPKTGDKNALFMWSLFVIISSAAVISILLYRKRHIRN